jgi:GNAT superfamily N-acetyltransferase
MLATIQQWLTQSMERHGTETTVLIAEDEQGERLGFASVSHHHHYTRDGQAYIGELAVAETVEGHGVGQALVGACEQWARSHGYSCLALATGAANTRARSLYSHLGFLEEDVTLVKLLL